MENQNSSMPNIEELKLIISEALNEHELTKLTGKQLPEQSQKIFLTRKQLCEKLNISLPTLWKHMKQGILPYVRIGRKIIFDEEIVFKTLEENQKKLNFSNR
ncbi:MAG: helix-turn-helix domain-containing protein [Bacteroidetes bacterium]|nr:MAG: helix-turn-helix domain-containing protein [Bacteroidota bacterium]